MRRTDMESPPSLDSSTAEEDRSLDRNPSDPILKENRLRFSKSECGVDG